MKVNSNFGKIKATGIILILAILIIALFYTTLLSCSPQQVFGELLICSDVDSQTFTPIDIGDEYEIDSPQIVAAIKVSGVRGDDRWRVIWENMDTGIVIADSSDVYSSGRPSYLEGYLPVILLPEDETSVVADPGKYLVSYYHNGELIDTASFTVKKPDAQILEVGFYKSIDKEGLQSKKTSTFFQEDEIFAVVKLDYRIMGDNYKIKWYLDDSLHKEDEYIVKENQYIPGNIIIQLVNEDGQPFPTGSYKMEILKGEKVEGKYSFDIIGAEYSKEIFSSNNIYTNQEFGFEFQYPDNWSYEEEFSEAGLRANLYPNDYLEKVIKIKMWALKSNYSPKPEDYSEYTDKLLYEQIEKGEDINIEKTEYSLSIEDQEIQEFRYDYNNNSGKGWSITFSFLQKDSILFLFMRYTDLVYVDYTKNVVSYIMGSISFIN